MNKSDAVGEIGQMWHIVAKRQENCSNGKCEKSQRGYKEL